MAAKCAKEHPDFKSGTKNPWSEKMTKHCEALAKDFEKLAIDVEKAADYHLLRAKELQGKRCTPPTTPCAAYQLALDFRAWNAWPPWTPAWRTR